MYKNNYDFFIKEINTTIEKQAKAIFDELFDMHKKGLNPNQSFNDLVKKLNPNEYSVYYFDIMREVIKLIPINLTISLDDQHIFMNETQRKNYYYNQKKKDLSNTLELDKVAKKILNQIVKIIKEKEKVNFYQLLHSSIPIKYNQEQNEFIREKIIENLDILDYTIVSLNPLIIEK